MVVKKFGKKLGTENHNYKWISEGNFILIRRNHNLGIYSLVKCQIRGMFAFKDSFGFELIIPIDSLMVIPFSCSEKNLRTIWHQQRLRAK